MHLDFQREEDVCTETCDRIDTVITIVIKTFTKLVREPQPLIPYERGGAGMLVASLRGCKFQILVSLRVFWAKHPYI